jgi:VWFA-related protein
MRRLVVMVCLGVLAGLGAGVRAGALPQEPNPSPQPVRPDEWPTFKTGTRLATIDAVVVDDQGRQITDLTAADFEVIERGKKQPVRQAPYIRTRAADAAATSGQPSGAATSPDALLPAGTRVSPLRARPLATAGSAATRGGRVIAIVVDDLGLSFESTAYVRQTLTRYVDSHVEPGDLVAIIRTAGGVGTLQQFTTDRRLLAAAIDRVRWSVHSRQGVGAFKPVVPEAFSLFDNKPKSRFPRPGEMGDSSLNHDGSFKADELKFRSELTTAGTLGALEYVVRGVESLPGRKSVVFVSEGFDLGIGDHKASRVWSAFTRVMDRANRAGVVVYSLDARGLQTASLTAEDDPQLRKPKVGMVPASGAQGSPQGNPGGADADFRKLITSGSYDRTRELLDSQDALVYLAEQTGGFAVLNTNDLASGLTRIADDTRGYYLLGFETLIPTTDAWDPNDVKVRVKRSGLHVRARRGLFGPADPGTRRDPVQADPLVAAALSPFATSEIDVRLTTLFAHDRKAGSFVRSLFYIDPAVITFVDGPDGRKDADLTLLLLAIGDNGRSAGQARRQLQLRLSAAEYQEMRQRGLLYSARLPMKDTGGFQVRAAVQDTRSKKIGTSTQYVEVPKVGKGQLALSGVVMMDVQAAGAGTSAAIATDSLDEGVLGEPAVKIFKPGAEVAYTCEIYDGRGGASEGVSTTATLLRDGQPIFTSPPAPVARASGERTAVPVGGRLSLGRQLAPGSYTLQVSVAPADAPARRRATQFAEFEVR